MLKKKTRPTNKIAQQIYLKRAGIASQIYAKYADSGTVPTNLISGGGIKPLANQQQATAPKPLETPKAPETPQQPTQPAAKPIEPIPANVAPPPVVPAPQSGLPPATPMAPAANPASAPAPNTINSNGQITGERAEPMRIETHIENAQNSGDSAQTHIAPAPDVHADAHPGITTPEAVNPPGQPAGQTGGQPVGQTPGQTPPNTGNQAQNAGQPDGQPSGQSPGQPATAKPPTPQFTEQELAQFDQMQDPKQFGAAFEKMTPEQQQQVAPRWVQKWASDPANKAMIDGARDLYSGDPQRANSPAAKQSQAFIQSLPQELQGKLSQENFQKLMAANPNATPQEQGNFMRQAWDQASQSVQSMPWPAQLMMGLGLGAGLVGLFSSMFGEGGAESGLMGLLGIGAAGLIGANYGMFGNDARMMMGQGALGLGRMMGMKIPDAGQLDPQAAAAQVQKAMDEGGKEKGWSAGQQHIDSMRGSLDTLASVDPETGVTMLMGWMNTNDPRVAKAKYDELMTHRSAMSDPGYLYNHAMEAGMQSPKAQKAPTEFKIPFTDTVVNPRAAGVIMELQKRYGDIPPEQLAALLKKYNQQPQK